MRTSTSLPSLPRHRDVVTQTEAWRLEDADSKAGVGGWRVEDSGGKGGGKVGVSKVAPRPVWPGRRQYRVSPKSRPAPPPPVPPPPPPLSPGPGRVSAYCHDPGSFSYTNTGYTSPLSTLNNMDSSFSFSSPASRSRVDLWRRETYIAIAYDAGKLFKISTEEISSTLTSAIQIK